jgi:hypothetical protein
MLLQVADVITTATALRSPLLREGNAAAAALMASTSQAAAYAVKLCGVAAAMVVLCQFTHRRWARAFLVVFAAASLYAVVNNVSYLARLAS